jgi:glycosyltransferase involved in cell wall biosynthesis
MKISVLMSVYKSEKPTYLDRSLQSVWEDQTRKPDEVILVQDGPVADELSSVIGQWKDKLGEALVLLVNETNLGLTKSLNKGIKVAKGEYIARMDSDDISLPDRFLHQVEFMDSHTEISVLGGSIQEFNDKDGIIGERHFPADTASIKQYIHKASPLAHPAVMIRKSLFDEGVLYNEEYRTTQDLALWFDVLATGHQMANLDEYVLQFRRETNVYQRRKNKVDSRLELKIHLKGIKTLFGFSPIKSIYPIARYILRLMPNSVIHWFYNGKLRGKILK